VHPLTELGNTVSAAPYSLAPRNLLRGWRMGLPSGQDVARAMGVEVLDDEDIRVRKSLNTDSDERKSIAEVDPVFKNNCPLWTYVLAEAAKNAEAVPIPVTESKSLSTPKLGPVGGRIVAEVFLGLMFGDGTFMLRRDPLWKPKDRPDYQLKDLVRDALQFKPN
jgi:hypothetical protein